MTCRQQSVAASLWKAHFVPVIVWPLSRTDGEIVEIVRPPDPPFLASRALLAMENATYRNLAKPILGRVVQTEASGHRRVLTGIVSTRAEASRRNGVGWKAV